MKFAINHITTPDLPVAQFFEMATTLGVRDVEIRNDVPDVVGTVAASEVKAAAEQAGVNIISINALYPFNVWSFELAAKAIQMADYAQASGAKALVMCPLNEGKEVSFDDLVASLKAIKPILDSRGLIGLVEPLGFTISSLRTKKEAARAITAAQGEGTFMLVHDTFHHHLASETVYFPELTGLVHISGVVDEEVSVDDMLDPHRVMVDASDRLGNLDQIKKLLAQGFDGPFSFEPFAKEVQNQPDGAKIIAQSMQFIKSGI